MIAPSKSALMFVVIATVITAVVAVLADGRPLAVAGYIVIAFVVGYVAASVAERYQR